LSGGLSASIVLDSTNTESQAFKVMMKLVLATRLLPHSSTDSGLVGAAVTRPLHSYM